MFIEKGHFFYGQHPGRPVAYTKDVMESAYDLLVGSEGSSMTGRLLRDKLVRAGVLPATSDIDTFMRPFRSRTSGQSNCLPHLRISGIMNPPRRVYSSSAPRRALKLAVSCNAVGGIFIKETTGTQYDGYVAEKVYQMRQGKALRDLTP